MAARKKKVIEAFHRAGGVLRTGQVLALGVHRRELYALREEGVLETLSRGVYRLAELPPLADPDLVTVALRVPKAVIAVISALHVHGLTTEIPHEVSIALPRGTAQPRLNWPPMRVYGAAKTVADCFKFRSGLGIDVPLEALRTGLAARKFTPADILRAAKLCRVDRVVRPYLEAMQ